MFPGTTLAKRYRRRRLLLHRRRPRWLNTTAIVSIIALVLFALVAALLNRRGGRGETAALADYARRTALPPAQLIAAGARTHRIVVLGDVSGSSAAKRTVADAIEAMATGPGLDAVLLEVDPDAQSYIDAYLESAPQDASILLAHAATMPGSDPNAYLGIYRRVWDLNARLGADRAITIEAIGMPGWPPARTLAPRQEADMLAGLATYMERKTEETVFAHNPGARVLVFVDGYQTLKSGQGYLAAGGGTPVRVGWLAAALDSAHAGDVYSVLQDGPPGGLREGASTAFTGTRAYPIFRDASRLTAPFGVPVTNAFDFLRQPIVTTASPGSQLTIQPSNYRLGEVVDGYIYLGPH